MNKTHSFLMVLIRSTKAVSENASNYKSEELIKDISSALVMHMNTLPFLECVLKNQCSSFSHDLSVTEMSYFSVL